MADDKFKGELAQLLARHGVRDLPTEAVRGPDIGIGERASGSYITQIITGAEAFDERVLERVVGVLKTK